MADPGFLVLAFYLFPGKLARAIELGAQSEPGEQGESKPSVQVSQG